MYTYDPIVDKKNRNCIIVGRAAAGIYLILKNIQGKKNKNRVIVPANLCYAAIYPILYAGYKPEFCDVDNFTGNVTYEKFISVCSEDTVAAIIPHMYGNPVSDMTAIAMHCKKSGIILIEDCASAMGARAEGYDLGEVGDYTIYSTNYAKILDLGYGGIVSSVNNLESLEEMDSLLNELSLDSSNNLEFFSKLYRLMRNEGHDTLIEQAIIKVLPQCCKNGFLYKINLEQKNNILSSLTTLTDIIKKRRFALSKFNENIIATGYIPYPYTNGAVPWRFNMLVEPETKNKLIKMLLAEGLPVSDWYPRATPLFNVKKEYPGTLWHEKYIINFPLLLDDNELLRICFIINKCLQ